MKYRNKIKSIAQKAMIILPFLGGVGGSFCSCSDDLVGSGDYTSSVSIVSQNVIFDAPASEGTIKFSAPGAATVSTTSDWCKTSLTGNTVKVSATQNNTRNSRSCNVVIKCGTDSAVVNVIQKGFVFEMSAGKTVMVNSDDAQDVSYIYNESLDFSLTPSADWFTTSVVNDSIRITLKENNTGHIRKGYLHYAAGAAHDSIPVIQYEYAKDVAGPAVLEYKDAKNEEHSMQIVLADSYFTLPEFANYGDWKIPFTYDAEKMMFNFTNAQDVGMYNNTYYVSDIMYGSGYYSTYKSVSWDAYINYNVEKGCMEAAMVDNSSWSYAFEAFYLRAFTSTTYSSATDKGAIAIFYSPVIIRYDQSSNVK